MPATAIQPASAMAARGAPRGRRTHLVLERPDGLYALCRPRTRRAFVIEPARHVDCARCLARMGAP